MLSQAFQTLERAFERLRENQKLGRLFQKLIRVFKKLDRVLKSSATSLCHNTAHTASISHGKTQLFYNLYL